MADDNTAGVLDLVAVVVVALLHRVEDLQTELEKYHFAAPLTSRGTLGKMYLIMATFADLGRLCNRTFLLLT